MKGHGTKFGQKKEAAIAALLAERNLAEAARAVGIDLSTLKRWMREPEFIQDYRRARWEVVEQGYARIQQNTPAAASVLFSILWLKPPAFSRIAFSWIVMHLFQRERPYRFRQMYFRDVFVHLQTV